MIFYFMAKELAQELYQLLVTELGHTLLALRALSPNVDWFISLNSINRLC